MASFGGRAASQSGPQSEAGAGRQAARPASRRAAASRRELLQVVQFSNVAPTPPVGGELPQHVGEWQEHESHAARLRARLPGDEREPAPDDRSAAFAFGRQRTDYEGRRGLTQAVSELKPLRVE